MFREFQHRRELLNQFVQLLRRSFKMNVVSLVGYGSFFDPNVKEAEDLDLVIILTKPNKNDLERIKDFYEKSHLDCKLQCQVIYKNCLLEEELYYSIHTCGPFFLSVLKKGVCLYGENIFSLLKPVDQKYLKISLLQKVQQYHFQLKNYYFNLSKSADLENLIHFMQKKFECFCVDTDLFYGRDSAILQGISAKDLKEIKQSLQGLNKKNIEIVLLKLIRFSQNIIIFMTDHLSKEFGVKYTKNT